MFSLSGIGYAVLLSSLPLLWLPLIPGLNVILLVSGATLCIAVLFKKYLAGRYLALGALLVCWNLLAAYQSLRPFDELIQRPVAAQVKIIRSDGVQNHEIEIVRINQKIVFPPVGVTLNGSYLSVPVCPGQSWKMTLRLRPVHGQLNDGIFDFQRYALSQHLPLSGRVIEAQKLNGECNVRGRWLQTVRAATQSLEWQGVIIALAFGERVDVNAEVKKILRDTGTAHLMAISGLHIALAGSIGWLLARFIQFFLPAHRIGYRFPLLASLAIGLFYTWLAGMNPPAVRTMVALCIWGLLRLSGKQWSSWEVWLCCVAGILLVDPLAILSDSLWLSAFAVAALIFWYQWVPLPRLTVKWYWKPIINLLHLQLGITLLLIPIQIALFHGVSVSSLVANLFAVPAITFISVPFIMGGMIFGQIPVIGENIWYLADQSLAAIFTFLTALPPGWFDVDGRFIWLAFFAWWAVITWRLYLWRNSPALVAAVIFCMSFPFWRKPLTADWAVHMLDVGHGLSIVIERGGKALIYDTGNAWPGGDAAKQIIIPWLRWHNFTPQEVIISHEHLDHRGGLTSLLQEWPGIIVRSPLRWVNHQPCFRGEQWEWQGLKFRAYWPPAERKAEGNNGSCVVMVSDGHFKILLTGDVEAPAELVMLKNNWRDLGADIIQVPHHGSRTSSASPLLRAVGGKVALASVSRYNAWRLPSGKVIERYKKHGYKWYDTAQSGQISIHINSEKWQITGFREQILPRWYHQWFGVTKDNG